MLDHIGNSAFKQITERDKQGLVELLERQFAEAQAYLDAIDARPISHASNNPATIELSRGNAIGA